MSYRNRSTIQSVIEEGLELKMTIKDLCFKEVMTNSSGEMFIINMYNLYEKYYELLLEQSTVVVLSDEEYRKYRFQPKLLALDLYGNKDIYYLIEKLLLAYDSQSITNKVGYLIKALKDDYKINFVTSLDNLIIVWEDELDRNENDPIIKKRVEYYKYKKLNS